MYDSAPFFRSMTLYSDNEKNNNITLNYVIEEGLTGEAPLPQKKEIQAPKDSAPERSACFLIPEK